MADFFKDVVECSVDMEEIEPYNNEFAESDRLTYKDELGISIDKGYCPTMSFCFACEMEVRQCPYFADAIQKLFDYEEAEEALVKMGGKWW